MNSTNKVTGIKGKGFIIYDADTWNSVPGTIYYFRCSESNSAYSTSTTTSTNTSTPSTDSSSPTDSLPRVKEFKNLDKPENLKAKVALKGLGGVYAFINDITGAVYIGSSINLAKRLVDHAVYKDTNAHLQNAFSKYGLGNFTYVVVEIFQVDPDVSMETNKALLLAMEQVYLTWGSSLPKGRLYNFLPIAGSSLGYKHTDETRAKMSDANKGENNPMYGCNGALNPMFGKYGITPTNAMTIYVYSLDDVLVRSFTSQVAAAEWLGVSNRTVYNYINSGKVWNKLYTLRKSTHLK